VIIGNKTSRLTTNLRFGDSITLIKRSTGNYVDGIYVEGAEETTELICHHQAATEDDRQNLPIGERMREVMKFYIKSDDRELIRPLRQGVDNSRGDILRVGTINYEVFSVDNYSWNGHIKALAIRRENQDD